MAASWPTAVNTKAYGMDTGYEDNTQVIEMKSGRRVVYLRNSTPRRTFTFSLRMEDVGASSEYKQFLSWYANTAMSGAVPFTFPNLITHTGTREYLFNGTPSARGQKYKEVTISCIEI